MKKKEERDHTGIFLDTSVRGLAALSGGSRATTERVNGTARRKVLRVNPRRRGTSKQSLNRVQGSLVTREEISGSSLQSKHSTGSRVLELSKEVTSRSPTKGVDVAGHVAV